MAKIFITGSADGLGLLGAQALISQGHQVYAHARNTSRAEEVKDKLAHVTEILTADLSNVEEVKQLAHKLNTFEKFDAIIHNAGIYSGKGNEFFTVNVLAPYVLTALVDLPQRLIYLSSSMHKNGRPLLNTEDIRHINYSDSKLHLTTLTKVVARLYPDIYVNAVDPGWVPTKMGGPQAPDNLQKGYETQVWLASSRDKEALVSGQYFYHQKLQQAHPDSDSMQSQETLIEICKEISGVSLDHN
ncbi:SDR family NAD(P)-dependent oxidoreductase [Fulvivirga sp. 29W222]|uniref:SDR family NAD(P)-dependent oxidoreductase n=1 Tax=Fulvivirga marina TaxID=2494733 RepID=A0A937G4W0_9BACT|nr:SDR family NAD(P)-dependent oxidoreductase [Fulvivirga marina]MBL6448481.1 SDR family NAD(P)-dependent oxidoreductase [Fulvivirga marina]